MNRLEENDLIEAMKETHRLRAALEAAERERDEAIKWRVETAKVAASLHDENIGQALELTDLEQALAEMTAERDALKERADTAEQGRDWQYDMAVKWRNRAVAAEAQADALRKQVEAARTIAARRPVLLNDGRSNPEYAPPGTHLWIGELLAALARLDQRETE